MHILLTLIANYNLHSMKPLPFYQIVFVDLGSGHSRYGEVCDEHPRFCQKSGGPLFDPLKIL
jgi:hypothetical protein